MPPLARLAQLVDVVNDDDLGTLATIFVLADKFVAHFDDSNFRDATSKIEHPRLPCENEQFNLGRAETEQLENALETLFQSPRPLKSDAPALDGFQGKLSLYQLVCRYMLF
jgi:hypothetical protein